MIVATFCGAGGSSLGIHQALPTATVVGIDSDHDACATHRRAGFATIRADVASYPLERCSGAEGTWHSPPCTAFSSAGKRTGMAHVAALLDYLRTWQPGDPTWTGDPLVWLVTEPLRWTLTLRPQWVACEQVPQVLPLWQATAERLRQVGYSTWAGSLNTADYGVPQTRTRAILMASRVRTAHPPVPTHAEHPQVRLDGTEKLPWVSMAHALGRGPCDFIAGPQKNATVRSIHEPAPTILASLDNGGARWVLDTHRDQRPDGSTQTRPLDQPAPSVTGKASGQWAFERSTRAVKVTLEELATLQGFPPSYQFVGNKSNRAEQIGNAVPPALAQAIVTALL